MRTKLPLLTLASILTLCAAQNNGLAAASAPAAQTIRIKTRASAPVTDSSGNVWQADQGFADGETIERPDLQIANTKDPMLYRAEHYSMTRFSQTVPDGKHQVKLHFCETFEGITEPNKIVPRTEKVDGLSANFTREFPAYSITVLKLKSK
jgi:hypothetical protein